jgi:hypothetical protein
MKRFVFRKTARNPSPPYPATYNEVAFSSLLR